ncbi:Eukaryotic membrane protein family protein [Cryptosporidium meleagridis]|uniref:Eukaryotic membrane protein family protein n=1 Tax=Cryptosporidium meleagridis TaxID=93969 RepID=A0A2P4YX23_9CRYT|nr:Eukaryotic membrane protein family protein [Cryptosporidium meleagridis]
MSKKQRKSTRNTLVKNENLNHMEDSEKLGLYTNGHNSNNDVSTYKEVLLNENSHSREKINNEVIKLTNSQENYPNHLEEESNSVSNLSSGNEEQIDDLKDYNQNGNKMENNIILSLEFIWSEIRSENVLEKKNFDYFEFEEDHLNDRIPKNFLNEVYQVPKKLEYLLNFSMLLCFDTILYDLTFLPINSIIALLKLFLLIFLNIINIFLFLITGKLTYFQNDSITQRVDNYNDSEDNIERDYSIDSSSWNLIQSTNKEQIKMGYKNNNELIENSSVEYLFEDKLIKSKSLINIPECDNKLRFRFNNKSKDDGFLSKNNNFFPQIRNHVHSYRMNDQRSSLEESELQSISASDIFYDEINNHHVYTKKKQDLKPFLSINLKKYFRFTAVELTDFSRFLVLLLSIYIFSRLDISFFYHYIRGQGLLKLYVIFNMLEIFEKLFRSFGRDLIDTYLESVIKFFTYIGFVDGSYNLEKSHSSFTKLFIDSFSKYFLVIIYLIIHCTIHMIRGLALNISLNSSEYTMFLIVITNNFAEIKSTVFKTYHSISLFTISCSDTIERFQLLYDGCILFIRMYSNARLYTDSIFSSVITWVVSVYLVEIIVDWFKHSFLVKFNKINSNCYSSYLDTLIGDVLLSRGSNQAFQYLMIDFNKKNLEENSSFEKLISKSTFNNGKFNNNSSSIGNLTRQGTCSLLRGSTIGLETDVSSVQIKDDAKVKKIKSDNFNILESKTPKKDPIFISKKLRGIYAFPYIVSRRIGFISLPLTILLMCVLLFSRLHSALCINHIIIIWLILFILKYLTSFIIVSISQNNIDRLKNWNFDFNKINAL